jgi:hypothetical protein
MYSPHELMAAQHGKRYGAGMKRHLCFGDPPGLSWTGSNPMSAVVRELTRRQSEVEELT